MTLDEYEVFDPSNIRLLFEQDDAMDATPAYEGPGLAMKDVLRLSDTELATFIKACKNALLLPLSDRFLHGIATVCGFAMGEQQEREKQARKRQERIRRFGESDWQSADIIAEIGAVVALTKRGREWKGLCPFHSERTPSFSVNAEKKAWHCHGCGRGGGVLAWRKAVAA